MKTHIKTVDGFNIYFEALEELTPLDELLFNDNESELKEVYNNNVIFCAKVTAEKASVILSTQYLGGCIYEKEEDFYIKYKDDYFTNMVDEAIKEAKKEILIVIKDLQELN